MALNDVEQQEIGDDLYRFHDTTISSRRCLITAHGLWAFTLDKPMKLGHASTQLIYYSAHGHVTEDIGLAEFTKGVGHEVERLDPQTSPDYLLKKYTNSTQGSSGLHSHNKAGETYATARYAASYEGIDIVTIRNRHGFDMIRLSRVLEQIWAKNLDYDEIHCVFCRGLLPNKPERTTATAS